MCYRNERILGVNGSYSMIPYKGGRKYCFTVDSDSYCWEGGEREFVVSGKKGGLLITMVKKVDRTADFLFDIDDSHEVSLTESEALFTENCFSWLKEELSSEPGQLFVHKVALRQSTQELVTRLGFGLI